MKIILMNPLFYEGWTLGGLADNIRSEAAVHGELRWDSCTQDGHKKCYKDTPEHNLK